MNEEPLRKYQEVFTDCQKLFREFSDPTSDDDFWQRLKEEAQKLTDKDKDSEMRRGMIKEVVLEIHRLWKKKAGDQY